MFQATSTFTHVFRTHIIQQYRQSTWAGYNIDYLMKNKAARSVSCFSFSQLPFAKIFIETQSIPPLLWTPIDQRDPPQLIAIQMQNQMHSTRQFLFNTRFRQGGGKIRNIYVKEIFTPTPSIATDIFGFKLCAPRASLTIEINYKIWILSVLKI